jgi:hypothetical protein
MQITAITPNGKDHTAGEKVVKRLLFNGVNRRSCDLAIVVTDDFAINIPPRTTETQLTGFEGTLVKTQLAGSFHS